MPPASLGKVPGAGEGAGVFPLVNKKAESRIGAITGGEVGFTLETLRRKIGCARASSAAEFSGIL